MNSSFMFFILVIVGIGIIYFIGQILSKIELPKKKKEAKKYVSSGGGGSYGGKSQKVTITTLKLPEEIDERMRPKEIGEISRKILETYKRCNYKDLSGNDITKLEWHSWQMSILLKQYRNGWDLPPQDIKEVFPQAVRNLDISSLYSKVQSIVTKYDKEVNFRLSRDRLSKQVIWSVEEAGILLYFLSVYNTETK